MPHMFQDEKWSEECTCSDGDTNLTPLSREKLGCDKKSEKKAAHDANNEAAALGSVGASEEVEAEVVVLEP